MREQGYYLPKSYRKIGLGFFILAILVSGSVFYLIWARVTIIITSDTEKVSQEFIFQIREKGVALSLASDDTVAGKVRSVEVESSESFSATGSKFIESGTVGEVTIINNYSKSQTLVETTRLAVSDNPEKVLVRLKKTVDVPAGGQLKVQVYADDYENFEDLKPMKFIIPGLWGPLQDKIYAQSTETLTKEGRAISVVIEDDIKQAESKLKEQLYRQALAEVNQQLEPQETLWSKLISAKVEEFNHDAEIGEEVAEFQAAMKLKAVIVIFDENQLISLTRDRLKSSLLTGNQSVSLNPKSFSYLVQDYNLDAGEATVNASFEGTILASAPELLDKSKLLGLTEEEVKLYFSQFPQVKSVEVKFQPAWLKKTPRLKGKIEIRVGE